VVAIPAENATDIQVEMIETNFTETNNTEKVSNDVKEDQKTEIKVDVDEEKLKKTFLKLASQANHQFPDYYPQGLNTFVQQKKIKHFENFPAVKNSDKKQGFMFNLFFGRDPTSEFGDLVEDHEEEEEEIIPFNPYRDDTESDIKEPQFYPPNFREQNPLKNIQQKFESFPYEKLAQAYDSYPVPNNNNNNNNNNRGYLNKEYTFKPYFSRNNGNSPMPENLQKIRDIERYDFLLDQRIKNGPYPQNFNEERVDSDIKYVFHPNFGYIPTHEIPEDDDIMDEIDPDQLFELHPRHGFVPVATGNNQFDQDYPTSGNRFESNFGNNFNSFRGQQQFQTRTPFNRFNLNRPFVSGTAPESPIVIEILKQEVIPAKVDDAIVEVKSASNEKEFLKRDRREPQYFYQPSPYFVYNNPNVVAYPNPFVGQQLVRPQFVEQQQQSPSVFYQQQHQPQYFDNPLERQGLRPSDVLKNPTFVKPHYTEYTLTDQMKSRRGEVDDEVLKVEEDDNVNDFPVESPGASVASEPLPESKYPLFPYDPAQDQAAAVAY
jgi:hypothetical protein